MSTSSKHRRKNLNLSPEILRLRPIAAICSGLFLVASASFAQEQAPAQEQKPSETLSATQEQKPAEAQAETDDIETVVVTGIRHGIESSIATKRNSNSIVEAISAEDLGKLPDVSIADSLARLPGLTAMRVDGRAQVVSIRGMSPDYAGALLNGREVVSSSDTRAAEYDQFPSELINSVLVYKTPDATLSGQGLSGTIDARTLMPLDAGGRKMAFNVRGERNSYGQLTGDAGGTGKRLSVSFVDQFADNTVGVALGYAYLDSPSQQKKYHAWESGDYTAWGAAPFAGVPAHALTTQGFDVGVTSGLQVRNGLMAVVEYKPNQDLHSVVDLFYSKFDQDKNESALLALAGPWSGLPNQPVYSNVGTSVINGNTVVTSGTMTNIQNMVRSDSLKRTDEMTAVGWKNTLKLADAWTAVADVSYSHSARDEKYIEIYAAPQTGATYNFSGLGVSGEQNFSTDQNLTDPSTVLLYDPKGWGNLKTPHITDELKGLRLSGKRDLDGVFSGFESGVNYSERNKVVSKGQFKLALKGGATSMAIPASALRGNASLGGTGFNGSILTFDVPSVLGQYDQTIANPWDAKDTNYEMHEKVTTVFGKLDIDTAVGALPIRGNVGAQLVHTNQLSNGLAWVNDKLYPVSDGTSYNDFLPSLNLNANFQPSLIGRLGLAKTMVRPRMDDLRAGADQPKVGNVVGTPGYGLWSASNGGNPRLEPWRAKAIDLSLEKYFGKRSYVAGAYFYKKLDTFIYNQSVTRDFSSFNNTILPGGVQPTSPIGTVTAPANGHGGKITGIELSASIEANLFAPVLDGFGVITSASATTSDLHEANNPNAKLDGLSGRVYTLTGYYEKHGFSTRISQRYRSAFEATTRGVLLQNVTSKIDAEKIVDFQMGYEFEEGEYKNLSVLLQVNNLTDSAYVTRQSPQVGAANPQGVLPMSSTTYGRQFLLGLNYKL